MPGIEFPDEQELDAMRTVEDTGPPAMVRLVMKVGGVGEREANWVLVGFVVIFLVAAVIIYIAPRNTAPQPTYLEDISEDVRGDLPPEILKTLPSRE